MLDLVRIASVNTVEWQAELIFLWFNKSNLWKQSRQSAAYSQSTQTRFLIQHWLRGRRLSAVHNPSIHKQEKNKITFKISKQSKSLLIFFKKLKLFRVFTSNSHILLYISLTNCQLIAVYKHLKCPRYGDVYCQKSSQLSDLKNINRYNFRGYSYISPRSSYEREINCCVMTSCATKKKEIF